MSDSNTTSDTIKKLTALNDSTLDSCIAALKEIKDGKMISEKSYHQLNNVVRELDILKDVFISRILFTLKRGDILT